MSNLKEELDDRVFEALKIAIGKNWASLLDAHHVTFTSRCGIIKIVVCMGKTGHHIQVMKANALNTNTHGFKTWEDFSVVASTQRVHSSEQEKLMREWFHELRGQALHRLMGV